MKNKTKKQKTCPEPSRRIAAFGGAFNPPHWAHLIIAKKIKQKLAPSKLIIIPYGTPALKPKERLAQACDRLVMTRLAFWPLGYEVSAIELKRKGKSYTINTIRQLKRKYPKAELYWIIGEDSLLEIIQGKWKGGMGILDKAKFVVVTRPGFSLKKLPKKFKNKAKEASKKVKIIKLKIPISSTEIRKRIKQGKNISGLVPKKVLAYIKKRKLYSY